MLFSNFEKKNELHVARTREIYAACGGSSFQQQIDVEFRKLQRRGLPELYLVVSAKTP